MSVNGRRRAQRGLISFLLLCALLQLAAVQPGWSQFTQREEDLVLEEFSLPLQPSQESEIHQALRILRHESLPGLTSIELRQALRRTADYPQLPQTHAVELFQALVAHRLQRTLSAERLIENILENAPRDSRVYAEAALLGALHHYGHAPLRRLDIEAGLEHLRTIERSHSLSAQVEPELTFWMAEGYRALGVLDQATEYYGRSIEKASDPKLHALATFRRAELFEHRNNLEEAERDFAITTNTAASPLVLLASVRRASVLRSLERYPEVLRELDRADSIMLEARMRIRTSARDLDYTSPLLEELLLLRTEPDRILGSTPDKFRHDVGMRVAPEVLASPLIQSEIALLRGSAYLESGRFAEATALLSNAELALVTQQDSLSRYAHPRNIRFLSNALQFEKAWSLYQQRKYTDAAREFLALSTTDTLASRVVQRAVTTSLRDRGRFADPFYEEPTSTAPATLDRELLFQAHVDTSFFFYNDFPERARFYAGVSFQRAGNLAEAERVFIGLGQDPTVLYSERARYQLGLINYAQKNYLASERLLEPISVTSTLEGGYASYLMGEMTFRRNLYSRAEQYMRHALALIPDTTTLLRRNAHFVRGMSLVALNSWEQAVQELREFTVGASATEHIDEALLWLGRAYLRINEHDSARVVLERLIERYPGTTRLPDAQYLLGWSHFLLGDYVAAERAFLRVLQLDTISRFAYDVLARSGDARFAINDLERANTHLNQAVDRPAFNNYRTTRALYQLGMTRQRLDSSRSALNAFSYLLQKFPNSEISDRTRFNLAVSAYTINQNERAEQEVERIVADHAASQYAPKALWLAAEERVHREDLNGSVRYYERLIANYPNARETGSALFALQDVLLRLDRFDEAIARGERFIASNPEHPLNPGISLNQGKLQLARRNATLARETFGRFISTYPEHSQIPEAKHQEALAYLVMGDTLRATERLLEVTRVHDTSTAASPSFLQLARLKRKHGDAASASAYFAQAYAPRYYSNDAAPVAMSEHAQMLTDLGRTDSAMRVLREVVERYTLETRAGARAQLRLAALIASQGNFGEARSLLEAIATVRLKDPIGGAAVVQIGEEDMERQWWSDALEQFARAKREYTLAADVEIRRLFGVARANEALGRKRDAAYAARVLLAQRGLSAADRDRARDLLQRVAPARSKSSKSSTSIKSKTSSKTASAKKSVKSAKKAATSKKGGKKR